MKRNGLQIERHADRLARVLPAPTHAEIAVRLSSLLREEVSISQVAAALGYVRQHHDIYGYTIPYAARGPNPTGDDRFFVVPKGRDGSSLSDDERAAIDHGKDSVVQSLVTWTWRLNATLVYIAQHTERRSEARFYRALAADFSYMSDKLSAYISEEEEAKSV